MSNINCTCPHCQMEMSFPSAAVGQQGNCSGCQQVITIQPDLPPPLPNPAAKKKKIIIIAASAASALGIVFLCISGSLLVYFNVFSSNLLSFSSEIDDYGQSVLEAFKSQDIEQFVATYASYEEHVKIKEEYDDLAKFKSPPLGTRKQFDDVIEKLEEDLATMFARNSMKIPTDATYLACHPGLIRSLEPLDLEITRQLGLERTNNGRIYVHDDTYLYMISVDNCVHTARGWFTDGDFVSVNVRPIDEDYKAEAKKGLEDLKNENLPDDMHPLTIECLLRLYKFIIDF